MNGKKTTFYLPVAIIAILSCVLLTTSQPAAAKKSFRTALVIGNSIYGSVDLKNPVNDATDMADMLSNLGFAVTLIKNANLQEMEEAIRDFGSRLRLGGVSLFYYAGHGFQVNGTNYLLPVNARITKESDVKYQSVDVNFILDTMSFANNRGINIILLDACRNNPFGGRFRSITRGLSIVGFAPAGTFISFATAPGGIAYDGAGRNSPYTAALLKYIPISGLTINDVFINVRLDVKKATGQVPWDVSSLEGQFYFAGSGNEPPAYKDTPIYSASPPDIDQDSPDLRKDDNTVSALLKQKSTPAININFSGPTPPAYLPSDAEHIKKGRLMILQPPVPSFKEIDRDDRYIAYNNGTVLDTKTLLMWPAKDSIHNYSRLSYVEMMCESYLGGKYTGWRLPTPDDLKSLYDPTKLNRFGYHMTELIQLSGGCLWHTELRFPFKNKICFGAEPDSFAKSWIIGSPCLPVRSAEWDHLISLTSPPQ